MRYSPRDVIHVYLFVMVKETSGVKNRIKKGFQQQPASTQIPQEIHVQPQRCLNTYSCIFIMEKKAPHTKQMYEGRFRQHITRVQTTTINDQILLQSCRNPNSWVLCIPCECFAHAVNQHTYRIPFSRRESLMRHTQSNGIPGKMRKHSAIFYMFIEF